jgi:hypothetical protein
LSFDEPDLSIYDDLTTTRKTLDPGIPPENDSKDAVHENT